MSSSCRQELWPTSTWTLPSEVIPSVERCGGGGGGGGGGSGISIFQSRKTKELRSRYLLWYSVGCG